VRNSWRETAEFFFEFYPIFLQVFLAKIFLKFRKGAGSMFLCLRVGGETKKTLFPSRSLIIFKYVSSTVYLPIVVLQ
jgi:hypothetical protein